MGELKELRTILTCPKCQHRYWLVLQNGSGPIHCECAACGWDGEDDMERAKVKLEKQDEQT